MFFSMSYTFDYVGESHSSWDFPLKSVVRPKRGKYKGMRGVVESMLPANAGVRFADGTLKRITYSGLDIEKPGRTVMSEKEVTSFYRDNYRTHKANIEGNFNLDFYFNPSSVLGVTDFGDMKIAFNIPYCHTGRESAIKDTVLHEIAHGVAGSEAGHGPQWKAACKVTGAKPKACKNYEESGKKFTPGTNFEQSVGMMVCESCGLTEDSKKFDSRRIRSLICTKCNGDMNYYSVNDLGKGKLKKTKKPSTLSADSKIYRTHYSNVSKMILELREARQLKDPLWKVLEEIEAIDEISKGDAKQIPAVVEKAKKELAAKWRSLAGRMEGQPQYKNIRDEISSALRSTGFSRGLTAKPGDEGNVEITDKHTNVFVCIDGCGNGEHGMTRRPVTDNRNCDECSKPMKYYTVGNSDYFGKENNMVKTPKPLLDSESIKTIQQIAKLIEYEGESVNIMKRYLNSNNIRRPALVKKWIQDIERQSRLDTDEKKEAQRALRQFREDDIVNLGSIQFRI